MDNTRLILFVALSIIVLLIWQAWERENTPPTPPPSATRSAAAPAPEAADVPSLPSETRAAPTVAAETSEASQRITVETDLLRVEIDTHGGDIRQLALRQHPVSVDKPEQPFVLMRETGTDAFYTQTGLIGRGPTWPNHKTLYRAERTTYALAPNQDRLEVVLHWSSPQGVEVNKVFIFQRDSYVVDVDYRVRNGSKEGHDLFVYAQLVRVNPDLDTLKLIPSYTGGVIYTPESKYEKIDFTDMAKKPLARDVVGGWVAIIQHYFLAAWLPDTERRDQFYTDTLAGGRYIIGYKSLEPTHIEAGQSATLHTRLYAGPKEQARLEKVAEGLKLTVDYGFLTFLSAPLFWGLEFLHGLVGNWGWAIILLTILIKLLFYPLSAASYKSMAQLRKLQPKMQAIKQRYGDDRQKQQQAMMELYRTEKINPFGGCLPILIQIPVFIALYWVLLESVEMRQAPFALWLNDLSAPDPYFVLPILMGATMLAQQWISPQALDPMQRKIMMVLPIVFTVFFLFFPAGLVLYWVVQNILSIAQQWWITRRYEAASG